MAIKGKKLDLVVINPRTRSQNFQSLGETLAAIEPPVWAGMVATFSRTLGFTVQIIDADAENMSPDVVALRVKEMDPLLAVVVVYGNQPSASTQNIPAAGAVCLAIKQLTDEVKVILIGGHVAALPELTLREESVDYVCAGEGLYTIADLVNMLRSGHIEDISKVKGLWYKDCDNIITNSPPPLVMDLDNEIPEVAWDLLPMKKYRAHNWHCFETLDREPYASLYTTLGCPYNCSFCCIQAPFKEGEKVIGFTENVNSYRRWSPNSVIAQLDKLVNQYGVRNVKITDEMFVLNRRHVDEICDQIIERGYDLNIWAYARIDTVKNGNLEKLKKAGFNWLAFGIEAGDEGVRQDINKSFEQSLVFETVESVRQAGIYIIANFIFGLPNDNLESMQTTLNMALDLNCEFANLYSAMAYPGSQLYDEAMKQGWPLPGNWTGYSQHSVDTLPLPTKYISGPEVLRFRDYAFETYFSNPEYLDMITSKFGIETAAHVREMASHKLIRNNV